MDDIRTEINAAFHRIAIRRIPKVYQSILDEISHAGNSHHPDWLKTLAQVEKYASRGLADNPRNHNVHRYQNNERTRHQNFFREPYEMSNAGIRAFCHNILAITPLAEPKRTLQYQASQRH